MVDRRSIVSSDCPDRFTRATPQSLSLYYLWGGARLDVGSRSKTCGPELLGGVQNDVAPSVENIPVSRITIEACLTRMDELKCLEKQVRLMVRNR